MWNDIKERYKKTQDENDVSDLFIGCGGKMKSDKTSITETIMRETTAINGTLKKK